MKQLLLSIAIFSGMAAMGQVDPHFSQYYAHPLALNPALTGAFEGRLRATAIYRGQWNDIGKGFSTSGLSADVTTGSNLNIGASVLSQKAGDGGYRYLNGSISVGYSGLRFGPDGNQQVLVALQAGLIDRRFDPTKFRMGDQWSPVNGYDPNVASQDQLAKTATSSLDLGAGLAWLDRTEDKNVNPFAGFSVIHLTRPYDAFASGSHYFLPFRFAVHGGARIRVSDNATVTPNLLYMRQGEAEEKMIGAAASVAVNEEADLLFGVNYRFQDAIAPFAGMRYGQFTLGVSYDQNVSNLGKMAGSANAFEVSLSFLTPKADNKGIPCPRF